jgi:hypothetical protein
LKHVKGALNLGRRKLHIARRPKAKAKLKMKAKPKVEAAESAEAAGAPGVVVGSSPQGKLGQLVQEVLDAMVSNDPKTRSTGLSKSRSLIKHGETLLQKASKPLTVDQVDGGHKNRYPGIVSESL